MIPDYLLQAAMDSQYGQAQPGAAWTAPQAPVSLGGQPMQPVSLGSVGEAVGAAAPYAQTVWDKLRGALNAPQQPVTIVSPQASQAPQAAPVIAPPAPAALPPEPAVEPQLEAAPAPTGPSPMSLVLDRAIAGTQQVVPGGFRRTGYQVAQEGPVAMPGADVERQGPTISTGVPDIDAATFRALSPQQKQEYLSRLSTQETKPLRVGPEPIDMDLIDALNPDQQQEYQRRLDAQTSMISTGPKSLAPTGEPIRPQSPHGRASADLGMSQDIARLGEEQTIEDRAANLELQGRAYAMQQARYEADAKRIEDDQSKRAAFIANELPRLEQYIDQRAKVQSMNPVDSYNQKIGFSGRLLNGIALGLSTLGSGLTGAPNVVWEMIQKEIDGEVYKQRQITESLGHQYMARRQLYADMLGQFLTPEAAEAATRYALQSAAVAEINKLGARSSSDDMKNAAGMLSSYAQVEADKQKKAALEGVQRTLWQDVPAKVVGDQGGIAGLVKQLKQIGIQDKDMAPIISMIVNKGTGAGAELIGTQKPTKSRDEMREVQYEGETSVPVPDRFAGFLGSKNLRAVDHSDAVKKREALNDGDRLLESYDRLEKLIKTGSTLNPTQRAEVEQISATTMGSWRTLLGLGVLSESDKELLVPISGIFANDILTLRDKKKMVDNLKSLVFRTIKTVGQTASKSDSSFIPAVKPIVAKDIK